MDSRREFFQCHNEKCQKKHSIDQIKSLILEGCSCFELNGEGYDYAFIAQCIECGEGMYYGFDSQKYPELLMAHKERIHNSTSQEESTSENQANDITSQNESHAIAKDMDPSEDQGTDQEKVTEPPGQDDDNKIQSKPEQDRLFKLTEYGNAERLVSRYGENIRFCYDWKKWLIWNGKYWQEDKSGKIMRMAKDTVRNIPSEAKDLPEKKQKNFYKHATNSENKTKLNNMIYLASSEPGIGIQSDFLDSNKWKLNVKNGTIDLHSGALLPHNKEDYITKTIPVEYNPIAQSPLWLNFLKDIMCGNIGLINFLKQIVGYTLTGDVSEQCLFFLYGSGSNGKSTFIEVIRKLIGDYAQQTDFSTFLSKSDNIRNDLARLKGARYVSGVEAAEGSKFTEVFIKRITGGDKITARFLYKEFFEYDPSFKVYLASNYKPIIKGTDYAIWRRIMLIPFTVKIDENRMDKQLKEKLFKELPGILNWAVQGCLEWQSSKGLIIPNEVKLATDRYRAEMDLIGNFLEDCCMIEPFSRTTKKVLYSAWQEWCRQNGEQEISKRTFGTRLFEKGFDDGKSGNVRYWIGITLSKPQSF